VTGGERISRGDAADAPGGAARGDAADAPGGAAPGNAADAPGGAAPGRPLATRRGALVLALGGGLAFARPAAAQAPTDVEQLERLLALEHRLLSAYEAALERDAIEPRLGETLLEHERDHVRGLELTLRGRGRASPRATVPPPRQGAALEGRDAFARFAIGLETETVDAYREVLTTFRNDRLLLPLGSIMSSGAQHVVALRQAAGDRLLAP
jgi:hypothetical protein